MGGPEKVMHVRVLELKPVEQMLPLLCPILFPSDQVFKHLMEKLNTESSRFLLSCEPIRKTLLTYLCHQEMNNRRTWVTSQVVNTDTGGPIKVCGVHTHDSVLSASLENSHAW